MRTLEQEFNSLQAQREACEAANEVRGGGAVGGQPDFLNALARCNDFCTGLKRQRRNDYSASRPSIPDAESQPFRQPKADSNPLPGCVAPPSCERSAASARHLHPGRQRPPARRCHSDLKPATDGVFVDDSLLERGRFEPSVPPRLGYR
jgi:hypothetical protein